MAHETNDYEELIKSIRDILSRFRRDSKPFSISIVPEELRKWNEDAYMPKAIAIGPRYKGTRKDLLQMDETKYRCMLSLLHRSKHTDPKQSLENCVVLFVDLCKEVRASYLGGVKLSDKDFAKIMLCDACFLLELLICKSNHFNERFESMLKPPGPGVELVKKEHLLTDLLVLENQIPLVLLQELSNKLFGKEAIAVQTLALNLFGYDVPDTMFDSGGGYDGCGSHFLELVHSYISWKSEKNLWRKEIQESLQIGSDVAINIGLPPTKLERCALILEAAGVKIITRGKEAKTLRSGFDFHIKFSNGMLKIPPLHITKETEVRWRNLIAWEQCHSGFGLKHSSTCAALLFDALICSEKDVQLLKNRQVIVIDDNKLKRSNKQLLEFFRAMVKGVDSGKINDSSYWEMIDELNNYSSRNLVKQFPAKMLHSWLPKATKETGKYLLRGYNFMITAISILAIVQTYYAIVSYYYPKN